MILLLWTIRKGEPTGLFSFMELDERDFEAIKRNRRIKDAHY